jgi:hypothetical protein
VRAQFGIDILNDEKNDINWCVRAASWTSGPSAGVTTTPSQREAEGLGRRR